jgi:hypothetical protein
MLFLQFRFDQLFGIPIEQLNPVKQTCTFFIHHSYSGITWIVNNYNNIPIFLHIVCHESLEVGFSIPIFLALCCWALSTWFIVLMCLHIACCKLWWSWLCNILDHKHDRPLLSNKWLTSHGQTWSMTFLNCPQAAFMQQAQLCSQPCQWTFWKERLSNQIFGLGSNIPRWNCKEF